MKRGALSPYRSIARLHVRSFGFRLVARTDHFPNLFFSPLLVTKTKYCIETSVSLFVLMCVSRPQTTINTVRF